MGYLGSRSDAPQRRVRTLWSRARPWQYCVAAVAVTAVIVAVMSLLLQGRITGDFVATGAFTAAAAAFMLIKLARGCQDRLEESEERYRALFRCSRDAVALVDAASRRLLDVNDAWLQLYGYSADAARRMTLDDLEAESMDAGIHARFAAAAGPIAWHRNKEGAVFPAEISRGEFLWHERPVYCCIVRDVSERLHTEDRIWRLARLDPVTGFPNRMVLLERLQQAIKRADRNQHRVAVMVIDLDQFKVINDSLGHAVGDRLLHGVGERIAECVADGASVARLGGDEFAVLVPEVVDDEELAHLAKALVQSFATPFEIDGRQLHVTSSVGISIYPSDARDVLDLLKNADAAMYHAKESGRNAFGFFTPDMNARVQERLQMETELRRALEQRGFYLCFQPQVSLKDQRICGVEALLRWQEGTQEAAGPDRFIPVAEASGLIVPIGEWVLRTACQLIGMQQRRGWPAFTIGVNVSAMQLQHGEFLDMVRQVLQDTGIDPRCLELEITESGIMKDIDTVIDTLEELSRMGVRLAVDDFGTGNSSLTYLKRLPIDRLKIDRSFMHDVPANRDDNAIVAATISLAHSLGLKVVAEGVESPAQLKFLTERQCDEAQGFLLGRPMGWEQLSVLLAQEEHAALE